MSLRGITRGRFVGLMIGLVLTATACIVHLAKTSDPLEFRALDPQFRLFRGTAKYDGLVYLDIDDSTIEKWRRWPWPRNDLAEIVDVLAASGTHLVAMDLLFPDPQAPFLDIEAHNAYAPIRGAARTVGKISEVNRIHPDERLAASMARAGNVYIGVSFVAEMNESRTGLPALFERHLEGLVERREAERLTEPQLVVLFKKVRAALTRGQSFGLDAGQLASRLSLDANHTALLTRQLGTFKRHLAIELVDQEVEERPDIDYATLHAKFLDTPADIPNRDTADLERAYARALGVQQTLARLEPVPAAVPDAYLKEVKPQALSPPWHLLAQHAKGVSFVVFDREQVGGVIRSQWLMARYRGKLIRQLGFAVACGALGISSDDITVDAAGHMTIEASENRPRMQVQLREHGGMLIDWRTPGVWQESFERMPVTEILELIDARRKHEQNSQLLDVACDRLATDPADPSAPQNTLLVDTRKKAYKALVTERVAAFSALRAALEDPHVTADVVADARSRLAAVRARTVELAAEAFPELKNLVTDIEGIEPADDDEAAYIRYVRALDAHAATYRSAQATLASLAADIAILESELRAKLRSKICFLGYSATAVADFRTMPPFPYGAPGVLVHMNILNNFLQRSFVRESGRGISTLLIALAGMATVLVTLFVGPVRSLLFVLTAMTVYFFVHGLGAWGQSGVWATGVMPLLTIFVVWAFVTLYRQLTEERSKRHVAKALGQYTAPEIARTIVEATTDLSPQEGEVTCFFSDLAGFTTISENLGAERTKAILNPYLEAMSKALIDRRAMINKFIGDAVFAFFNPPLLLCADHHRAGCEAALDAMAALERLRRGKEHPALKDDLQRLAMRIGVNSGPVFVGDYGSESKLDYTCIGDTVNLAARLEPANKVFGTGIMISGSTLAGAGAEHFEVRHLGGLQVKGKAKAVQVYELLGRPGAVDDEPRRFAEQFGQAVATFQQRDFAAARRAFAQCMEMRPGDLGAQRYLETIKQHETTPPPDDWNGAIELTSK